MDYAALDLPIIEARVDWLTCSARRGVRASELVDLAESYVLREVDLGDKLDEYRFQGYLGFQAGHVRWGWGKHGALVVMSGDLAHGAAPQLAVLADHWSRIDYSVTVFDVERAINPPDDYWQAYLRLYPDLNSPIRLSRLQDFGRGATVNLGARTGATYLRVYDKHHESKGDYAPGCWRWEVELKREQSEAQQTRWRESIVFPTYIIGLVRQWTSNHQLQCPWSADAVLVPPGALRVRRDADRILAWLDAQVRPSVEWVAAARGEKAVKEVLRLT